MRHNLELLSLISWLLSRLARRLEGNTRNRGGGAGRDCAEVVETELVEEVEAVLAKIEIEVELSEVDEVLTAVELVEEKATEEEVVLGDIVGPSSGRVIGPTAGYISISSHCTTHSTAVDSTPS